MREIRVHGRGGQGAVTAGDMIVTAAVMGGDFGSSFPLYGDARRGAPVVAFVALDKERIRQKTQVYTPDCLIILDPKLKDWPETYEGIKPGGIVVVNYGRAMEEQLHPNISKTGVVDATGIALEEIGIPAFNTCMLGAFAATTGWVEFDAILAALETSFSGDLLKKNIRSAERGFREVNVSNW
jgi:2-oxoacid:acceptor oxidoreductase gamma subunit (pyruvate/2-ketoisovalerate family)